MQPVLTAEGLSKRFGSFTALDNVDISVRRGEVHAVLGENGAGKSTLVGLLSGLSSPTSGSIRFEPGIGFDRVAMVHQHFMLVPRFSVRENIELAALSHSNRHAFDIAQTTARELGWEIPWDQAIESLPVGMQQRVEILKALMVQPEIVILDEPTAVLTREEVQDLFRILHTLKGQNKAIILIAHKLSEVTEIADTLSILRRGKLVAACPLSKTNASQIIEWMVGEVPSQPSRTNNAVGPPLLEVHAINVLGDRGEIAVKDLSFTLRSRHIFGVGGVDGNGQVELAEAVLGTRRILSGAIEHLGPHPRALAYIPPDRRKDGVALNMSILENLYVGLFPASASGMTSLASQRNRALELTEQFDVRMGSIHDPIRVLSGGNMQKVILARTIGIEPTIVVAVNPTRGLDIRSTAFVRQQLLSVAERGAAVLLISNDLDELAEIAHDQRFISRGQWSGDTLSAALG